MRIALALDAAVAAGTEIAAAIEADRAGVAAVVLPRIGGGEAALAAAIAAVTTDVRLVVPVVLGSDNPTTLAEELAVVDQIAGGRVVAAIDATEVDADAAAEDLAVLEAAWSGRFVDLPARWRVDEPVRVAVTPFPAQLTMPLWRTVVDADDLARAAGADAVRLPLTGDLEADRAAIVDLASAGAAMAIVIADASIAIERYIARYVIPEAAMPHFPRIISDSAWPASLHHTEPAPS